MGKRVFRCDVLVATEGLLVVLLLLNTCIIVSLVSFGIVAKGTVVELLCPWWN